MTFECYGQPMKRLCLALLLLPCADLLADTRDQALKLSDVVISANRQVQARNDSSAANTVFTRADIDRLQPTSVTDLLSRVPGVQVAPTGGRGSLPGIFIRGTKSAQSLVLVDGQRIANTTSGDSGLQYLNVDQIERVEVLRGSRSVIYGSDAIGGVIQVFTRRNAEQGLQPRLKLGFGSNQTGSAAWVCRAAMNTRASTWARAWMKPPASTRATRRSLVTATMMPTATSPSA